MVTSYGHCNVLFLLELLSGKAGIVLTSTYPATRIGANDLVFAAFQTRPVKMIVQVPLTLKAMSLAGVKNSVLHQLTQEGDFLRRKDRKGQLPPQHKTIKAISGSYQFPRIAMKPRGEGELP